MTTLEQQLAREIFEIMRLQKPGDIEELRRIAARCKLHGFDQLAEHAETMAALFEQEDQTK